MGAISAGVEMSLVSAWRQLLMLIAGYSQEVSSTRKDRQNRTHVDLSGCRASQRLDRYQIILLGEQLAQGC